MEIQTNKDRLTIGQILQHYGLLTNKNSPLYCSFYNHKILSLQVYPTYTIRYITRLLFFFTFFLLFSCASNQQGKVPATAQKTDDGLNYQFFVKNQKAQKPKVGDYVTYHLVMKDNQKKVIQSTYDNLQGAIIEHKVQKPRFKGGNIDEMLLLMSKGDSATFWVDVDTLLSKTGQNYPVHLKKGSKLNYTFKILDVKTKAQVKDAQQKQLNGQLKKEIKQIEKYLSDTFSPNILAQTHKTPSGVHCVFNKKGYGKKPKKGDVVLLNYKGKLLDGTECDQTPPKLPLQSSAGMGNFLEGLDQGIMLCREGSKATLLCPSRLAFGEELVASKVNIPANSVVVYEVELLKVM